MLRRLMGAGATDSEQPTRPSTWFAAALSGGKGGNFLLSLAVAPGNPGISRGRVQRIVTRPITAAPRWAVGGGALFACGLALTSSFVHGHAYMATPPTQLDRIESALARLEADLTRTRLLVSQQLNVLAATFAGEQIMSAQLDALTAQVAQNTSVEGSAIQLLTNLGTQLTAVSAQLAAAGADTAALDGIRTTLATSQAALAAAITANTPAAPPSTV